MSEIIPAILEQSFAEITAKIARVAGAAQTVQLDICDGVFVESVTWPYLKAVPENGEPLYDGAFRALMSDESEMPDWEQVDFELDLMVSDARRLLPDLLAIGPSRVVIHAEALGDILKDTEAFRKFLPGLVELSIALNPDTNVETIFSVLDAELATGVQCMGIAKIGIQGAPFDERVLETLKTLRAKYPELPLAVDGGVNRETISRLREAGATHFITGSAIFSADDAESAFAQLASMIQ